MTPAAGPARRGEGGSAARLAGWVALAVLLLGALFVGVTDTGGERSPEARERDVASSVACPTCAGQSVADSDASAARSIRSYIADRVAEGAGDDDIRAELADRFGEQVLLTPGRSGLAGLVWVLPVAVLVVAFAGLALAFRRWRGQGTARASAADRLLVQRAQADAPAGDPGDPGGVSP